MIFSSPFILLGKEVIKLKKIILFTILVILLISAIVSTNIIIPDSGDGQKDERDQELVLELEEKVMNHLFEKGYMVEDIHDLEVKFNSKIGNVPDAYSVYVIFEDDKEMTYIYDKINGDIVQTGFSGPDDVGKHLEVVED